MKTFLYIGLVKAFLKTFTVLYFLILPILFAEKIIDSTQLGYIGSLLIVGTFLTGLGLSYIPNKFRRSTLLFCTLFLILFALILLAIIQSITILIISYLLLGAAVGIGFITTDEIAASLSEKGKRFGSFANMAMISDLIRMATPAIAGVIYISFGIKGLIAFAFVVLFITLILVIFFSRKYNLSKKVEVEIIESAGPIKLLKKNRPFAFVLFLELFDSFASSQLFVFLPTLLLFKNFTIEYAVGLQSIVFLGYFSGRWLVSHLAKRFDGYKALAIAESGMIIVIILLLLLPSSIILYFLCFLLGAFARGTSPVIKSMIFDNLETSQSRQGAALYMMAGDGGSALGQFFFGLLLAWFGVNAPFLAAAIAALVVVFGSITKFKKSTIS